FCAGRCARVVLPDGSRYDYAYDAYGNQTETTLTIAGTAYTSRRVYAPSGQVTSLTYPDGSVIVSTFNAAGSLTEVGADGGVPYAKYSDFDAFGDPGLTSFGNSTSEQRNYDVRGR